MKRYEKSFNIVCRLCLRYDDTNKNTSLVDSERKNGLSVYGETVTNLLSLHIDFNDKLPKNMCSGCKNELNRFECFKIMCKTNCKRLNSLVNDHNKKSSDDVNTGTATQYSMFTQYFPDRYQGFYSKMALGDIPIKHVKEKNLTNDIKPSKMDSNATLSYKDDTVVPKVEVEIDYSHAVVPKVEIEIECMDTNKVSDHESENALTKVDSQSKTKTVEGLRSLLDQLGTLPKQKKEQQHVVKAQTPNLTCNVCNKKLSNKSNYKVHMQSHKKSNICDQCGKHFSTVIYMKKHQITHHGVPSSFECDTCSFRATSHLELIEHIRLHTGERPFTCEKCGLTFRRKYIYRRHLKCHDEKKVQCPKCPMKFYLLSEMKAHMNNIHERMYLYLCHICNMSYANSLCVRKHLVSKHGIAREIQGKVLRVTKDTHGDLFKDNKG